MFFPARDKLSTLRQDGNFACNAAPREMIAFIYNKQRNTDNYRQSDLKKLRFSLGRRGI